MCNYHSDAVAYATKEIKRGEMLHPRLGVAVSGVSDHPSFTAKVAFS